MVRLGGELKALHVLSGTAQEAVATLTARIVPDHQLSEGIQVLDSLTQHLDALTRFVNDLAAALPASERVDLTVAAGDIRLERLRRRLMGEIAPDHAGDVELF